MMHCHRCGSDWENEVPNPVRCAVCRSRDYATPRIPDMVPYVEAVKLERERG